MTDDQLTDVWERGALGRSISHEEHVRIAFVLLRRHGPLQGTRRLVDATRINCEALGASERFDEPLTLQWADAIVEASEGHGDETADELLRRRPDLLRSDLLGLPAWRRADR